MTTTAPRRQTGTGAAPGTSTAGQQGGIDQDRLPDAGRHAGPDRHAGPRRLRADRAELRVPRHARRGRRARPRSRRVVGAQRGRHRVDVQPAPGRQVAGRRRLHVGRRRRHDGPLGRRRQRRARRRHRRGRGRHHRPQRRRVQPRGSQRQLPLPRLGVQRPDAHHAGELRDRHDARRDAQRNGAVEARQLRPRHRLLRSNATPTSGAARHSSTARRCSSSATSARW